MERNTGPYPNPSFKKQIANAVVPMMYSYSGEITAKINNQPMGAVVTSGKVAGVWMSVGASGKDDSNTLQVAGDVFINGTSCLTTNPVIAHVSGEVSQQKTTVETGDTGITQAAIDGDNNSFSPGDVITCEFDLTRTASPTTEMLNPSMVVEFEPA